jgi:hypothetical protein
MRGGSENERDTEGNAAIFASAGQDMYEDVDEAVIECPKKRIAVDGKPEHRGEEDSVIVLWVGDGTGKPTYSLSHREECGIEDDMVWHHHLFARIMN